MKRCLFLFLALICLSFDNQRTRFLIQKGEVVEALKLTKEALDKEGIEDFPLWQTLGLKILEQGIVSSSPEEILLTLYGARLAMDEKAFFIFERAMAFKQYPMIQDLALSFLYQTEDEHKIPLLRAALGEYDPFIRLQAAAFLALSKSEDIGLTLHSLQSKFPPEFHFLFPRLFALAGDGTSLLFLKKCFSEGHEETHLEAIHATAQFHCETLLPLVRDMFTHTSERELEAAALCLGVLHDESSIVPLKALLTSSPHAHVRLAAAHALDMLFQKEGREYILEEVRSKNPFAISLAISLPDSTDLLLPLMDASDKEVSLNAALALIHKQEVRALTYLHRFFLNPDEELFLPEYSPGKTSSYIKIFPHVKYPQENLREYTLKEREYMLMLTAQKYPVAAFSDLADVLLSHGKKDLIPLLCTLLEKNPEYIPLLQKYAQKVGDSFTRTFCLLSLYRIKRESIYEQQLIDFVKHHCQASIIQLRPHASLELLHTDIPELTPRDTSRLLMEIFEALTSSKSVEGERILFEALLTGNPANRFALAGLLIRLSR